MVSFVGSGTTSHERDTGDYSCTLRWTQRSCLLEAQLPHQHQGWPFQKLRGPQEEVLRPLPSPGATATPWPTAGSGSTPGSLHLKGRPSLPGTGRPTHLDYLSPPRGPLYLLVSSMGHRWATKPSQVMWERTTPRSKELTTRTQGLGRSATESQAEGEAEQVMMRLASPGPPGMQILGGPISQSLFKPIFKTYSTW